MMATSPALSRVSKPLPSTKHIPALDGVRALAILAVLVFHFFQHRPMVATSITTTILKITNLGSGGVDLFFVLSGFLITGILIDAKGHQHALRNFYIRRVLRIFPLYYGFLFVLFVALPVLNVAPRVPWSDQWWYWSYCSNLQATFSNHFPDGPGHFWSLAIEEQFYMIWPFVALRYPVRKLCYVCGALILGAILTRAILQSGGFQPYYFTFARMDALACGALLASVIRLDGGAEALRVWGRKLVLWTAPILAVIYGLMSGRANAAVQVTKYTLIAILSACIMVFAMNSQPGAVFSRMLTNRPVRSLGKYSYGMYVLHPAIIAFLQSKTLNLPILVTLPLAILTTFSAAWFVWHIWEQPFLRLKRLFPSSGDPS